MLIRRFYKGAAFNSGFLKIVGPIINFADRVAQSFLKTNRKADLPSFELRARSNGVLNQFGGRRFVEHSEKFVSMLNEKNMIPNNSHFVFLEIGCGVGRLLRAMSIEYSQFKYIGVDIDPVSIEYCKKIYSNSEHEFHLINVSNGAYRPDGIEEPTSVTLEMLTDGDADLVVSWSVFTHMEIEHIRHYLNKIALKLKPGGRFVFSAFVYDDRDWIRKNFRYPHRDGYTVNVANPMKAIAFSENIYLDAIERAGFTLVEPFIPLNSTIDNNKVVHSQGQDIFVLTK